MTGVGTIALTVDARAVIGHEICAGGETNLQNRAPDAGVNFGYTRSRNRYEWIQPSILAARFCHATSAFLTASKPIRIMQTLIADVAELADAQVSEACDGDIVEVQVLSSAPY